MSNMIPQETADAFRWFSNISVENYGMPCRLYVPNNLSTVMTQDVYTKPSDYTYDDYYTKVWIEWSPTKRQLAKLGIFSEDATPMIAHFSNIFRSAFRNITDLDITIGSYFSLDINYIANMGKATNEFEIVDVLAEGMANRLLKKIFKIAPRRVKT